MKITGRRIVWILGCLCVVAGFLSIPICDAPRRWGYSMLILGVILLSLAELLDRVARTDALLKSSAPPSTDRIRKMVGDLDRLRHVADQATCAGCGRRAPRTDLCYNQALDAYYHRECLAQDLSWSERSRNPQDRWSISESDDD